MTNYQKFEKEITARAATGVCFDCPAREGCPECGADIHGEGAAEKCDTHFIAWAGKEYREAKK